MCYAMLDLKILELFSKFSCAMLMLNLLCAKNYGQSPFFPIEDLNEKVYSHIS